MKKSFFQKIVDVMKVRDFARAGSVARLATLGLVMLLMGLPAVAKDQYLLVGSIASNDILRYDANTGAFAGVLIPSGTGGMGQPQSMTIGPDGNLYIGSGSNILEFDSQTGKFLETFVSDSQMGQPIGLNFGPDGNLYVSDPGAHDGSKVFRFDGKTGASMGVFATTEPSERNPGFIGSAWGPDGDLYVAMGWDGYVAHFDGATGARLANLSTPEIEYGNGAMFGPDGLLYVSDYWIGEVEVYDIHTGTHVKTLDGGMYGAANMEFRDDGSLLVASVFTDHIFEFKSGSDSPTVFAAASSPYALVLSAVPEPSTYIMLLAGSCLLGFMARRRKESVI
ncbi:PEP motif putative anchor domain protein [Nitrosomonas sp. Is79A3]|uniref:PEP-CTERM sorting domain-containing protein n=1 Tax=Nitrosomonas sp. (strain Is79A3) TaxID=261292 RepID=UPI000215C8A6